MATPQQLSSTPTTRTVDGKPVQMRIEKYSDGRIVTLRWDPNGKNWDPIDESVDDELAKTWDRRQAAEASSDKTENAAPRTEHLSDGTVVAWDPASKTWKPIDESKTAPKPMSEYESAQVARQKGIDERANRTEARADTTAKVAEGRADRAERGRQKLAELQAKVQQGTLDERKAAAEWDKFKFENYDLPRQQRADALAERSANRQDAAESRLITTDERRARIDTAKYGQDAGNDAVDRARAAHTQTALGNYAKGGIDAVWGTPSPDFDAIAATASQRAIAELQGLGAAPPAAAAGPAGPPVTPVAARPPVAPPPAPVAPQPQPQAPVSPLEPVAPGRFGQ